MKKKEDKELTDRKYRRCAGENGSIVTQRTETVSAHKYPGGKGNLSLDMDARPFLRSLSHFQPTDRAIEGK